MEWYYGCENSGFLVPNEQEDWVKRHPSPESWSEWGIRTPPQACLMMDTNETEEEFNFIDESFNNEIEFDHSQYDKDRSSSSSVCEGLTEQPFQQTALLCDHHQPKYQLQDLSTFECTDDIFLTLYKHEPVIAWDSVLEDFPCVESLHKSFFYPENQCSNTTGGVQKGFAASDLVPCNLDSKDSLDIEGRAFKVLDPFEQSKGDETMLEQSSLEEFTLQDFEMIIAQFPEKTRIGFRDAMYRLARNIKQHVVEDLDGALDMHQAMPESVYNETMRSEDNRPMESETNRVDRALASLMFNKMELNILDLPLTTLVNMKQEVTGSKCLQGQRSKALDVAQESRYTPGELPTNVEVPRFEPKNQEVTESCIVHADPTKKSFMLEFG